MADWVLQLFGQRIKLITEAANAAQAVEMIIRSGIDTAMNTYN